MPDHDMVVQRDFERVRCHLQLARHLDVFPRRLGVTGRMVVHQYPSDHITLNQRALLLRGEIAGVWARGR
jgi:hypothetical protein